MMCDNPIFDMSDIYDKTVKHSQTGLSNVIQIYDHLGTKYTGVIRENDTLADLYQKCYAAIYSKTLNLGKVKSNVDFAVKDFIPGSYLQTRHTQDKYSVEVVCKEENTIYDIFVHDASGRILSIPYNSKARFGNFKRENQDYFVSCANVPVVNVYKIYVVTDESVMFLKQRAQEEQEYSVVKQLKKYMNCRF
jgi:hypothetical protein